MDKKTLIITVLLLLGFSVVGYMQYQILSVAVSKTSKNSSVNEKQVLDISKNSASSPESTADKRASSTQTEREFFQAIADTLNVVILLPTYVPDDDYLKPMRIEVDYERKEYTIDYFPLGTDLDAMQNEFEAVQMLSFFGVYDPKKNWSIDANYAKTIKLGKRNVDVYWSAADEQHYYPVLAWNENGCTYGVTAKIPYEEYDAPSVKEQEAKFFEELCKVINSVKQIAD